MSATNESTEINYEGGQCHVPFTETTPSLSLPKPNYTLRFHNKDGDEVGCMDFNGPGLSFEGIADLSAITFMDWISQVFMGRLKDERNKVREECIKILENAPEPDGIDCAEHIRKEIER